MIASRLDSRVTLSRPTVRVTESGMRSLIFEPVGDTHAERVRMEGRSATEAGEAFADYSAEWRVRWRRDVKAGWRLHDPESGILYVIDNIIPNRRKGLLLLKCSRVNSPENDG